MNLATLIGTKLNGTEAFVLHVQVDIWGGIFAIAFNERVVVAIVRDGDFIDDPRIEGVGLHQGDVVVVIDSRPIDRAFGGQAPAAIGINERFAKDVYSDTEAVRGAEVVIHASVIGILSIRLRIEEGEAANLVWQPGIGVGASTGRVVRTARSVGVVAASRVRSDGRLSS